MIAIVTKAWFSIDALSAIHKFLENKKSSWQNQGLSPIVTPEGLRLWLCDYHAKQYGRSNDDRPWYCNKVHLTWNCVQGNVQSEIAHYAQQSSPTQTGVTSDFSQRRQTFNYAIAIWIARKEARVRPTWVVSSKVCSVNASCHFVRITCENDNPTLEKI